MHDEKAVLDALHQGSREALRQIYLEYKDDLLGLATCLLANPAAAEDCLHDVFVRLAEQARTLHIRGNLKGYLLTCVANRARDFWRKPARPLALDDAPVLAAADSEPGADLARQEENARLLAALAELPEEQRRIIALHLKGDLSFRAIAKLEGISVNTVMSRYRYGIEKLRKLLQEVKL